MKKQCFIYYKERCWLSRYTNEKCDDLKNQFKKKLCQHFDKKSAYYIANFNSMKSNPDNNLNNKDLNKMKALIIDIQLLPLATFNY